MPTQHSALVGITRDRPDLTRAPVSFSGGDGDRPLDDGQVLVLQPERHPEPGPKLGVSRAMRICPVTRETPANGQHRPVPQEEDRSNRVKMVGVTRPRL